MMGRQASHCQPFRMPTVHNRRASTAEGQPAMGQRRFQRRPARAPVAKKIINPILLLVNVRQVLAKFAQIGKFAYAHARIRPISGAPFKEAHNAAICHAMRRQHVLYVARAKAS